MRYIDEDHDCTWRRGYMKIADEWLALLKEKDLQRARRILAERRLREARACLRYIEQGYECDDDYYDGQSCNERGEESPCQVCAARRGLKRIRAVKP